ncbi:rieske domain-containing protein [Haematococcus lacustris]|uniref:Rieske domain-containing protein n=1 Tax=Haematococcus lacustris TaxID=44745 RepID=A0A699YBA0_HAELA|nr:rieske domain-containing protein [Haematococcus lacustris]
MDFCLNTNKHAYHYLHRSLNGAMISCCGLSSGMADAAPSIEQLGEKVADSGALPEGGRLQLKLMGRYITVLRLQGKALCIDAVCFHAGGPLGIGDIEEVNGRACLVCPWHYYKIDIESGRLQQYTPGLPVQAPAVPGGRVARACPEAILLS